MAATSTTSVGAQEQFQIDFTFNGSDFNSVRNFQPPNFNNFVVLSGPNQSTNMSWVNGKMSASVVYSYVLYARGTGKQTIGPASIEYKGSMLKTQPLTIEVTAAKAQPKTSQPAQQTSQQGGAVNLSDNVILRAVVSRSRVRVGEQITLTYKLYTRVQLYDYYIPKMPAYDGFWAEELEQPQRPQFTPETVDGKQYYSAMMRRVALFPRQSGNLKISPMDLRCKVVVQQKKSKDPFDSFFDDPFFNRGQVVEQEVKSNTATIAVDPLPPAPAGFSGAVGKFNFNATIDKREVKAGDPITLHITVNGQGNVKLMTLPSPVIPQDFESYDPKLSEESAKTNGIISGKKGAEYLLIPRNPGLRTIEPFAFVYFDIDRNKFVSIASPKFDIIIKPGKQVAGPGPLQSKEDVRLLGQDIRYIKLSSGTFTPIGELPISTTWLLFGFFVPPLAFVAAFAYRKRLDRLAGNIKSMKFQKAGREAAKRLKFARKLFDQGNTESYHAELSRALLDYLADKLLIPKANLTIDVAVESLEKKNVDPETCAQLKTCVDRAEFARFAPASDTRESRKDLLDAAISAINAIEQQFGQKRMPSKDSRTS